MTLTIENPYAATLAELQTALEAVATNEPCRFLITGSRSWTNWVILRDALRLVHRYLPNAVLVHGHAYGADCLGAAIWQHAGGAVEPHPALWQHHGNQAGMIRNRKMVDSGVLICLAFINNNSPGATGCAQYAAHQNVPTIRFTSTTTGADPHAATRA